MKILSWNIKSFTSCVNNGTDGLAVLKALMTHFELIAIYEVSNTPKGNNAVSDLVTELNNIPGTARSYDSFTVPTGGIGKENDQVAVIWDTNTIDVTNTTPTRRGRFYVGRAPVYFNVTEQNTWEFCAWHAPKPSNNPSDITQGWQYIQNDAQQITNGPRQTSIIMGDFNANLTPRGFGRGGYFQKIFQQGATTLIKNAPQPLPSTAAYRTTNLYDQFFVDKNLVASNDWHGEIIFDVLHQLVNNAVPFKNLFPNNRYYSTPKLAYDFYLSHISDHLPVSIDIDL